MASNPLRAALDIETTGLNPWEDRIVTVAVVSNLGDDVEVFDSSTDESGILFDLDFYLEQSGFENVATWNGSEFDMPFIAVRRLLNGHSPRRGMLIVPTGEQGKYGKRRYEGAWGFDEGTLPLNFSDIAYEFEDYCKLKDVKWNLKALAAHFKLGHVEGPDFEGGTSILDLTAGERALYCTSDAQLALSLDEARSRLFRPAGSGQAVLYDGPMTIL